MKKIEIIIRPEKFEQLKEVLTEKGISGLMMTNIMGFGNQLGYTQQYRGTKYSVNLVTKLRVETVVETEKVDEIIEAIREKIASGSVGDGKIFVYNVENVVRIRTGETGRDAL